VKKLIKQFKELNFFMKLAVIVVMLFVGSAVVAGIYDAIINPEDKVEKESTEEPKEDEQEDETESDSRRVIELNQEITSADYTVEILRTIIEDDILTVIFEWENQSDWDPAHFELLGFVEVKQGNEILEEISSDRKYKKVDHGQFDRYDLEYKLVDDSDIKIRVISTSEYDGSDGTVEVEYE